MGRLAELHAGRACRSPRASPSPSTPTGGTARESGLDERIDAVIDRLGSSPTDAEVEAASAEIRAAVREPPRCRPTLTADASPRPTRSCACAASTSTCRSRCARRRRARTPPTPRSRASSTPTSGSRASQRVLDAVRSCWGSLFTGRALAYRLRKGISHHAMPIAVGVIELIHARASGVAFSVHPVTGKTDRIVVETQLGLGRGDRAGPRRPRPRRGRQGRRAGAAVRRRAQADRLGVRLRRRAAVTEIDMPAKLADRRVLDEEQVGAIAAAVRVDRGALRLPGRRRVGDLAGTAGRATRCASCRPGR